MMNKGSLVISLDFELIWGAIDLWTPEGYGQSHILQVREVVKRLIMLFEKYEVRATFATVGLLMLRDVNDIKQHMPSITPTYSNEALRPYGVYLNYVEKQNPHLFFAPELVELLKRSSNIEIGTHTFSHYYCWEPGQTSEQFDADIAMMEKVAEENGLKFESIVFPKNQVSENYLAICTKYGIMTYRGNAKKYFNETQNRWKELYYKIARLLDAYVNWGGNTSHSYASLQKDTLPMNVPASRMLRPYMRCLRFLEGMRLRRIKKEMKYAAEHHELYHLWWHPHNFGADMDENFAFLEKVLRYYKECHAEYGMESMTMNEFYLKHNNK